MNDEAILKMLGSKIQNGLQSLIDDDFSWLDVPFHKNIGDSLIACGTAAFLKALPSRLLYKASNIFFNDSYLPHRGIILMHGGGNFGDLWPSHHRFRTGIIAQRTRQRIVVLPQTVWYQDKKNLQADKEIYGRHPDLTICARDAGSFHFLQEHFPRNRILLMPDMAFCLNLEEYRRNSLSGRDLYLCRTDKEIGTHEDAERNFIRDDQQHGQLEVRDWPGVVPREGAWQQLQETAAHYQTRLARRMIGWNMRGLWVSDSFGLKGSRFSEQQMRIGIRMFLQYDRIYTNRLHGMILALLLAKPVVCFDNSYGKNSAFFNTWLRELDGCRFVYP
ncbi:polysaccharide pyruvyl transferase family protein [Niabella sp.]|uniref:polysaccharide pyruvyl transferase family protein n=1 Tax=Niabella sp. TaxID=1962976 RepID=UPI00261FDEE0|nr:polysaccharide pyruvyl transferase family protein [Niabella sp.]